MGSYKRAAGHRGTTTVEMKFLSSLILVALVSTACGQLRNFELVKSDEGDCSIVKRRVCNGQTHKVRSDGTRITCKDGKFTAGEEEDSENCEWYGQAYCSG